MFYPCCHVWSLLSKKTTLTLPLLHRQAKEKVDSRSGYRPEIPDERAAAGGEGRQRRRVAARPWGEEALSPRALREEALSPRGRASHSVDGGSTRYVMTSFLLIPRRYSCRDLRRLAQINAKLRTRRAPLLRGRVLRPSRQQHSYPNCSKPLRDDTGLPQYFHPDLPSTT